MPILFQFSLYLENRVSVRMSLFTLSESPRPSLNQYRFLWSIREQLECQRWDAYLNESLKKFKDQQGKKFQFSSQENVSF